MTRPLFPQIEEEIVLASKRDRPSRRESRPRATWRSRTVIATGTVLSAGALAVGLTANPASSAVQTTPPELARAVPALKAPAVPVPPALTKIFSGDGPPSPDETGNVDLGRPVAARVPGAPASWVVPTDTGACFAMFDASKSISISCATTSEIKTTGLAGTLKAADSSGRETGEAVEIGIGGPGAGADGSFTSRR